MVMQGTRKPYSGGVLTIEGNTDLPSEFIKVGKDIEEAIGRTVFVDQRELNAVVSLYQHLVRRKVLVGQETLLLWLNGKPAIGGFNRVQAIMAHTGIIFPEATGVKLGKDSQKFIRQQMESKQVHNHRSGDGHDDE